MDGTAIKAMMAEIAPVIRDYVAAETGPLVKRLAELESRPAPELDSVLILRLVKEEVAKIPPAENGKDADPEQVASLVAEEVGRAVSALPAPQDGKSVEIEEVLPAIAAEVGKAVADLPVPRHVKGVVVNRDGEGIYTYSDGTTENIGKIVGKDGLDGKDGADGLPGEPGKDGRDGFSLNDFDANVSEDGRSVIMSFEQDADRFEVEMKFPVPIYRGVFKDGEGYEPGDMVTWGGSVWHCDEKTTAKPDVGPWRLSVKKGRDGKDAK